MDKVGTQQSAQTSAYYPGRDDDWKRKTPEEVGMDARLLQEAIDYSNDPAHEGLSRDLEKIIAEQIGGRRHDDGAILGPIKERGAVTGVVLRHGYLVSEWGEPERVDMTFSVSKSFLTTVAGLAWDRDLIRDVHDPVKDYVDDGGFDSPHNSKITWDQMLRQTNEWDGSMWGKHYAAGNPDDELHAPQEPGTIYEYNNVRVNRLALALLRVWRRPLPEVLKEEVMDPIAASDTWQWNGYRNSRVTIDGQEMQSVGGGGHWGDGMWISATDQARFGYLCLRQGRWGDRQILSEKWLEMASTPGKPLPIRGLIGGPTYGFMNWMLNTGRELMPSAPESSYYHLGWGDNRVWVDPEHDLVVVLRWMEGDHFDGFVSRVLAAVKG